MAEVITVSALNQYVKTLLDANDILFDLALRGEIANFVQNARSGHCYFSLRDASASVKAVMFRSDARRLGLYSNNSAIREWLYNSTKEQRQIDPGVLENTTVGVTIDTDDTSIADADLVSLVANSAGITQEDAPSKITVIRALSAASKNTDAVPVTAPAQKAKLPLPLLIAIGAGGLLLVLLIALLILSRQHLKASEEERQALLEQIPDGGAITEDSQNAIAADNKTKNDGNISLLTEEEQSALQGQDDELKKNEEILNLKMQHSLKLKQEIGSFVDENPQIAAKLIQNWLLTGGGNDGRNRGK